MQQVTDRSTGLPRWDLPDGRYVLADSAIDGGGVRIVGLNGIPEACGASEVAAELGARHPALLRSSAATEGARKAHAAGGRALAQIMRDARRWRV